MYYPSANLQQCERAAYFLITLSEGTVAVFSRPHERPVNQQDIAEFAVNAVLLTLGETKETVY